MADTNEKLEEAQKEVVESTKNPNSFKTLAKNALNKANLSRYIGLVTVLAITIVLSLWTVGWNPEKIGWQKFVANTCILLFLGIYGLFFGEGEGKNFFKKLVTGLYQAVLGRFRKRVNSITAKGYVDALPDYISWRYQKDYENTCKMKMLSLRLFEQKILDLTDEQLEELKHNPIKVNDKLYFSKISEEQYKLIMDIKQGKVFVDYIDDYNFYLVEDATDGKQLVTIVKETNKRKEKISWKQRISRVVMILLVALIIAGFFIEIPVTPVGELTPEQLAAIKEARIQAAKDLLSRLADLVVSIASGINTARLLNLEDVFVLKYKDSFNTVFEACMDNKTFVRPDNQAKAKADYEQFQKEQEEAKARVVTPEIVEKLDEPEVRQIEEKPIVYGGCKDAGIESSTPTTEHLK